jgi:hypothetical protein
MFIKNSFLSPFLDMHMYIIWEKDGMSDLVGCRFYFSQFSDKDPLLLFQCFFFFFDLV